MTKITRVNQLKAAGLGTAMEESALVGDCRGQHSRMAERKWQFCPHCGMKLEMIATCPTCNHNFYSAAAWKMHKSRHKPTCPKCQIKTTIQMLPRGLEFVGPNGKCAGAGTKYRCGDCGTLFAWSQVGLKATELTLKEKGNNPLW